MADNRPPTTDSRELRVVGEIRNLYISLYTKFSKCGWKNAFLWEHCLRSLVSIESNLAEGNRRGRKEQLHFIRIAEGSMAEFEFQLSLLQVSGKDEHDRIDMIKAMIYNLKAAVRKSPSVSEVGCPLSEVV